MNELDGTDRQQGSCFRYQQFTHLAFTFPHFMCIFTYYNS